MILCTVCARGGSKGVPGKNLRPILGRPLIEHTIEKARSSEAFDAVAVSSDSTAILAAAGNAGADLLIRRPDDIASDDAGKVDAIRHCVAVSEEQLGASVRVVVDLDATSPLRSVSDIRDAIALLEPDVSNVITASPSRGPPLQPR